MSKRPSCELCWAEFDTEEELAQHVEIEEHLTYRVDGEGYEDETMVDLGGGMVVPLRELIEDDDE